MLLHAFVLIFIAEMADKTQFMMMALSMRYTIKNVLLGMIGGIVIITGISVLIGDLIGDFIPVAIIKVFGGVMFLVFGLWNLRSSNKEEEGKHTYSIATHLPILSIACAFIIAELGDKTQLATVALAADHMHAHIVIFIGSSLGLILANVVGIFAGKFLFSILSQDHIKIVSSFCFFFFGSTTLFEAFHGSLLIYIVYSCILVCASYAIFSYSRRHTSLNKHISNI